jgi:hypothetical protein
MNDTDPDRGGVEVKVEAIAVILTSLVEPVVNSVTQYAFHCRFDTRDCSALIN